MKYKGSFDCLLIVYCFYFVFFIFLNEFHLVKNQKIENFIKLYKKVQNGVNLYLSKNMYKLVPAW